MWLSMCLATKSATVRMFFTHILIIQRLSLMSDFKDLKKFECTDNVVKKKVSLFKLGLQYLRGAGVCGVIWIKCPCEKRKNFNGFKSEYDSIHSHCKGKYHLALVEGLQHDFEKHGVTCLIQRMTYKKFWMHEFTVNTKKAIYITFRVRGHRDSSLLATIRITALDPNFEFDYKGSVTHEVIDKMEETCSAIQTLAGAKAENAYFCACVARNELLNWCCGGMTQATSSFTSAIARNQDEEDPHDDDEEDPHDDDEEDPHDDDEEEPEEVPREVPHVDEAVSSTTSRSFFGNEKMKKAYLLKKKEMAKIGIFIDPDLDDDGNKIVKEPHQIKQLQKEVVDDDDEEKKDEKEPHDVDEATSSTTDQASIADRVKARSEQKQLEAEEERERRKIDCDEIRDTKLRDNLSERKLLQKSLNFQKALEIIEKEEEDM